MKLDAITKLLLKRYELTEDEKSDSEFEERRKRAQEEERRRMIARSRVATKFLRGEYNKK